MSALRRIAIVGAESTGKSWLAQTLTEVLSARGESVQWVHEHLRTWCAREGRTPLPHEQLPIAQAQADVVVLNGRLAAVPELLALARRTRRVIRQNLAWALTYNLACVPLAVLGVLPPWLAGAGMALSSLVVVANAARLARADGDR